jgi:Cof subfamily protein (haloacid dehalogenase superfamily)
MHKVIISDLDGTLLNSRHTVSELTRRTLRTLVEGGVRFMVASGRHVIDMRAIRNLLGFECDLIAANGAMVDNARNETLFHHALPDALSRELIAGMTRATEHYDINLYLREGWWVAREMPEWLEFHRESGFVYTVSDRLAELDPASIHKIYFTGVHEALLELEQALTERYPGQASVVFSRPDCLEVMAPNVNKGNAIKETLALDGLELSDAIAFGDGMNDFEMLSMVGHGILMQNAAPRLAEALPSHRRARHCDEDGVAHHLIEIYGL